MVVKNITCTGVKIADNMAQHGFIKTDVRVVHRVFVIDIGVAAQAKGALRVFKELKIAHKIILVVFCPDAG